MQCVVLYNIPPFSSLANGTLSAPFALFSETSLIRTPMGQKKVSFTRVEMYARVVVGAGKGVILERCPQFRGVLIERGSTVYIYLCLYVVPGQNVPNSSECWNHYSPLVVHHQLHQSPNQPPVHDLLDARVWAVGQEGGSPAGVAEDVWVLLVEQLGKDWDAPQRLWTLYVLVVDNN